MGALTDNKYDKAHTDQILYGLFVLYGEKKKDKL